MIQYAVSGTQVEVEGIAYGDRDSEAAVEAFKASQARTASVRRMCVGLGREACSAMPGRAAAAGAVAGEITTYLYYASCGRIDDCPYRAKQEELNMMKMLPEDLTSSGS